MNTARKCMFLTLLPLLMLLSASVAFAQSQLISGTVVDQKGAVVPNASVKITDEAKKLLAREVTTGDNGRFEALGVQPGSYSITVEAPGFKKLVSQITLEVNTKLDVGELRLEIGEVSDTVSIVAETPLVQTNTGEKAFLVENRQITELPLNGRNWVALMNTVPGVISSNRSDFETNFNDVSGFHANGGRGSQNNFYLDGSPNLDVGDNQSQYTQPSVYSIGEFKVQQSGFNAEFGRNSGVVIAVQTKSGGSGFHGTAYEYVRNDALDAKRHEAGANDKKDVLRYNLFGGNFGGWIPLPKISTKANKRLFFFYNREMTRRNIPEPGPSFIDIPGAQTLVNGDFSPFLVDGIHQGPATQMTCAPFFVGTIFRPGTVTYGTTGNCAGQITGGTPFPGNIVPPAQWNGKTANLLKVFTQVPGFSSFASVGQGLVRWPISRPDSLRKNQDLLRIDYNLNSTTTTFFRWVNDDQSESFSHPIWGWQSFSTFPPIGAFRRPKPGSSWSWNVVKTISPTLASETILSYNHQSQSLSPTDKALDRDALGVNFPQLFPATNTANFIPNIEVWGGNNTPTIVLEWGSPGWHNTGKDYAITENLSWVRGSHSMKFGGYFNLDNKTQTANFGSAQGTLDFAAASTNPGNTSSELANLLLGNISNYNQASAHIYPYFRFESWEGYAQDAWKINKRLTLEYGVRFQRTTPTFTYTRGGTPGGEGTFLLYSLDLSKYSAATAPQINLTNGQVVGNRVTAYQANGLICDPCAGVNRGFAKTKNYLSPRVSFAYDVFGDGKTALRGGFGVYVERLRQNNFNFGAGNNFPNGGGDAITNTNINNARAGTTDPTQPGNPQGYTIFPVDNTMPTIYSWNVGIQRDLGHNFGLDVSYVGNHSVHLMLQRQINTLPAGYFLANPNANTSVNGFTDALRPFRGFGSINSVETSGFASYRAMLVRLSRRLTKGLHFNVNYTWSRTLDVVDNDDGQLDNPFDIRANLAPAGYDATHSLTIDYIYEFPKFKGDNVFARGLLNDWELSGITHYQSGFPFNVTANGNLFGIDAGVQYPNLVGDPYAGQTKAHWLNPAAFARPADGQRGDLGRHALRGPGYSNFDVSFGRVIKYHERVNFKISADVFNAFNHPQVFAVNTGFSADAPGAGPSAGTRNPVNGLGTISQFRDSRIVQFGFRLQF